MDLRDVRLSDRYDIDRSPVLLSGTQALVRAVLMQRARDKAAGLDTAGYVSGYRGSPLGAVDGVFHAAGKYLAEAQVKFQPGLNEDLAATALWGTQQAELRGEGKHQGVFGLFYGKGPGIDRTGDVFRHANLAGTSAHGGVLVAMGDDHTCESSTTCHQSEMAMMDAMIPILSPAGVQELIDYMLHGWALSRYSGLWVGIKSMKDTVEATAVVDGEPGRVKIRLPEDFVMPRDGLNIRLNDTPQIQEARLHDYKRFAAQAYARANGLDRRVHGAPGARIGIVSSGKSWLDVVHALDLLGLRDEDMRRLGITTYKVGMVWPLETQRLLEFARDLDLIVVVEEKRPVIETQLKEILFGMPGHPDVVGWKDAEGHLLFSVKMDLNPVVIAMGLGMQMLEAGIQHSPIERGLERLVKLSEAGKAPELAERKPWFCAGCPHNTSTRLPEGSRAYAGIGCHYMVQWMDRETLGFTHMGGEGANWIGEAPFSKRPHVFQNLGDGTYNHSGIMAIRAAVAADTRITFKILYNDAVAMTGGQPHDGGLGPDRIAAELLGIGVRRVVAVVDEKETVPTLPPSVPVHPRDDLIAVERELEQEDGVTALLYIQTCAAEKRRRRKRGKFPDPDRRVFINPSVCEGCGDCGVQSNCVAILPLETPLGRKRQIDQSACNKDFSCLKGFCPSFVTVEGAVPKARSAADFTLPNLPEPKLPPLARPWNVLITGVGGTGVVTVGALLSMAAHLEKKGASEMQMAGLAQKGGAVSIHCRIAPSPADINSIRIAAGEADAVIGGDLVVTAAPKSLGAMERGRTQVICNTHEIVTGEFTHNAEFRLPTARLELALERHVGVDALTMIDATRLAETLLGDAIYANVLLLGAAWQAGMIPLSGEAIRKAIELNGAGVDGNLRAFAIGRWTVSHPQDARAAAEPKNGADETLDQKIARRADFLAGYQNRRLARRYTALVDQARDAEAATGATGFAEAVAEGYFKLLSYKDEYEVARLHSQTLGTALDQAFDSVGKVTYHMAPPLFARKDAEGRPVKGEYGRWMGTAMRLLAKFRFLRATPLDPFGYSAERRMERRMIREYRGLMREILRDLDASNAAAAIQLARLPRKVRGFGHVKLANAARAAEERAVLIERFRSGAMPHLRAAE
ncbi:MAG TPA: indolepyruvate ferredoxin oxidoreductase family protein [Thermohalobaculum sp.]|nr:indolepyruvate ferredoxin oxidoreductase family protein [Thermohalobaculum sp.]